MHFFLALVSFNNYATDGNKKGDENILLAKYSLSNNKLFNSYDTEYDLALMNLQVDIMDFLMFGSQVTLDFQFVNMIAVGSYIRWNYVGLIYQGVITDWFYEATLVTCKLWNWCSGRSFNSEMSKSLHFDVTFFLTKRNLRFLLKMSGLQ